MRSFFLLLGLCALCRDNDPAIEHFEKKIRPVLVRQCYRCHSVEKRQRGGLAVDSRKALLKGGDTGAALVPGKPEESLLLKAMSYSDSELQMPPKGVLSKEIQADFKKWIASGAPFPGGAATTSAKKGIDIEKGKRFWAFRPIQDVKPPIVKDKSWPHSDIDRFILAPIEEKGFKPADDADSMTLLRRLHFDLIGLPPTLEEIEAFKKSSVEALVDQLLKSPEFGVRWGRHWLDVARYADSSGGGRTMLFPQAWRYRDYVIDSFNDDKPYDQFIREQIAGDLLPYKTAQQRSEQMTATAYLALGPTNYELQDKTVLEMDVIDEQLDTIGKSILGLTIGCARCHDHKFDPIPQKDYYALAGIFRSTKTLIHSNVSKWVEMPLPASGSKLESIKAHQSKVAALQEQIKQLRKKGVKGSSQSTALSDLNGIVIDDEKAIASGNWSKSTFNKAFVGKGYIYHGGTGNLEETLQFIPSIEKAGLYEVRVAYTHGGNRASNAKVTVISADGAKTTTINQQKPPPLDGHFVSLGRFRFGVGKSGMVVISTQKANGVVIGDAVQFLPEGSVARKKVKKKAGTQSQRQLLKKLQQDLKQLQKSAPKRETIMVVNEGEKIADCPLCIRGNIHNPGDSVPRGFLQVLTRGEMPKLSSKESGRKALARWITSRDNPLTARVMVNRVWHHLFGHGLVRTVDNFGAMGETPSHPQLLDYLAKKFMDDGWSIKKLIRRIVLSRVYQQASVNPKVSDMENRLFARMSRRRLDAEAIRDAILLVSGQLDRRKGGPSIKKGTSIEYGYKFETTRRSVYVPIFRNTLLELHEVFDVADPNLVMGRRNVSTTSTQALYLLNSPFALEQAKHAAIESLESKEKRRIERAYWKTLGRSPTVKEKQLATRFLSSLTKSSTEKERIQTWARLYQVLFACVDFRYLN